MSSTKLEFAAEQRDPVTRIYRLAGPLFGSDAGYAFQEDLRGAVAAGMKKFVIDLSKVDRIDSSGIGILVASMWSASHGGAGLVLAALLPRVEKVLGLAMLLDHIGHALSVDEALRRLDSMDLSAPSPR